MSTRSNTSARRGLPGNPGSSAQRHCAALPGRSAFLLFLIFCLSPLPAFAHQSKLSAVSIEPLGSSYRLTIKLHRDDALAVAPTLASRNVGELEAYVAVRIRMEDSTGVACIKENRYARLEREQAELVYQVVCPAGSGELAYRNTLFAGLDAQSRQLLAVAGASARIIDNSGVPQTLGLSQPKSAGSYLKALLRFGMEHALAGWDHLLFVACIICLCAGLGEVLVRITLFTAAHCISLLLLASGALSAPAIFFEAGILVSLLFVGVEALRRSPLLPPAIAIGVFGLLHGGGFANNLLELMAGREVPWLAIIVFNLGVEIGQLIFITCFLALCAGLDWLARRQGWGHGRARAVISRLAGAISVLASLGAGAAALAQGIGIG